MPLIPLREFTMLLLNYFIWVTDSTLVVPGLRRMWINRFISSSWDQIFDCMLGKTVWISKRPKLFADEIATVHLYGGDPFIYLRKVWNWQANTSSYKTTFRENAWIPWLLLWRTVVNIFCEHLNTVRMLQRLKFTNAIWEENNTFLTVSFWKVWLW